MLFILVGVCGVLSGFVAPAARRWLAGDLGLLEFIGAAVGGGFVLAAIGASVGFGHYRRWRGVSWGTAVGFGMGVMVGPLIVISESEALGQSLMALLGSFVLLLIGVAMRYNNSRK